MYIEVGYSQIKMFLNVGTDDKYSIPTTKIALNSLLTTNGYINAHGIDDYNYIGKTYYGIVDTGMGSVPKLVCGPLTIEHKDNNGSQDANTHPEYKINDTPVNKGNIYTKQDGSVIDCNKNITGTTPTIGGKRRSRKTTKRVKRHKRAKRANKRTRRV